MILGVGIDIVDIEEFTRIVNLSRENFLDLVFTKKERAEAKSKKGVKNLAGIFSGKEAIFKCLNFSKSKTEPRSPQESGAKVKKKTKFSSPVKDFNYFKEIEITHLSSGKPEVKFFGSLAKEFPKQKFKVFISVSYTSKLASSLALIEKM